MNDMILNDMILIPAGEFMMGSDDGYNDEKPAHKVYLGAYYIDRYPVTNAEYKRFVDATGHRQPNWKGGTYPAGKADHPVVRVSWEDATAYAQWAGKRLPTEAEWEKAARGVDGRRWPWGNEWGAGRCNSQETGIGDTTPVGKYSPAGDSPYGSADMAGNVWEWVGDWYDDTYYASSPARNPMGPSHPVIPNRVVRGGAWDYDDNDARSAYRDHYVLIYCDRWVGFRCASFAPALGRTKEGE